MQVVSAGSPAAAAPQIESGVSTPIPTRFARGTRPFVDALILRGSPNSLSAARSLGRAGLQVVVAGTGTDPAIRYSRFIARFETLDDIDDRTIGSRLLDLNSQHDKPFLLATGDQDALLVAKHQARLSEKFCFVCPSYAVLEGIIDKAKLYPTAKRHGIPHPTFHIVSDANDIDAAIANVGTPCYVKPALAHEWRRFRRGKLERANSPDELRHALLSFIEMRLVAIPMEIIPGGDSEVYSVSTYIDRNGNSVGWRTKRKLRQFPVNAGDGCVQEICDQPAIAELGLRLLAITGHRGPATVEFRRDERDGRFVLMEINARTILGQEMITRSGLDVPLLAYHDAKGLPLPPVTPARPMRWVFLGPDYRAYKELRKNGLLTLGAWLRSLIPCRSFAYFALDDPGPFLARIALWLSRLLQGRTRHSRGPNL